MAATTKNLINDFSGLKPQPQYFNATSDQYETVQGSNGASNVQVTQPLPAGSNIIGLVKLSDGTDALAINTNGSINIVPFNAAGAELFTASNPGSMSLMGSFVSLQKVMNVAVPAGSGVTLGDIDITTYRYIVVTVRTANDYISHNFTIKIVFMDYNFTLARFLNEVSKPFTDTQRASTGYIEKGSNIAAVIIENNYSSAMNYDIYLWGVI